jgi:hypothetical protein
MPDSFAYRERPAATPRDPLHPALITVIQNRLLEEGAHLADGSRLETSANGVSWRLQSGGSSCRGHRRPVRRRQLHCLDGHEGRVSAVTVSLAGTVISE